MAGGSETLRILLNTMKVLAHLMSTLSYCLEYPASMELLITIASTFALDVFSETKIPCLVTAFSFYDKLHAAMLAPVLIIVVSLLGGVLWVSCKPKKRKRKGFAAHHRDRRLHGQGEKGVFLKGVWTAAPVALFIIDLLFPTITKTLCSFLTCRNLGRAGWYLESSYDTKCAEQGDGHENQDKKYALYLPLVVCVALLYSLGIPLFFYFLVRRYKYLGKAGNADVQSALGWMYEPFRNGMECTSPKCSMLSCDVFPAHFPCVVTLCID